MRFRVVLVERLAWTDTPSSWFWRLMSGGNNKTLAHSETYSTKRDALNAAQALADTLGVEVEETVG